MDLIRRKRLRETPRGEGGRTATMLLCLGSWMTWRWKRQLCVIGLLCFIGTCYLLHTFDMSLRNWMRKSSFSVFQSLLPLSPVTIVTKDTSLLTFWNMRIRWKRHLRVRKEARRHVSARRRRRRWRRRLWLVERWKIADNVAASVSLPDEVNPALAIAEPLAHPHRLRVCDARRTWPHLAPHSPPHPFVRDLPVPRMPRRSERFLTVYLSVSGHRRRRKPLWNGI